MSQIKMTSIAAFLLSTAVAAFIGAIPAAGQRPAQTDPQRPPPQAPPPAPTRPQPPPPPPPTRDQDAAAQQQQQQREANARAEQQREAAARAQQQQEQQRIQNARQEQQARDQERIAKAREGAATATPAAASDPKYRDTIERLYAAEHQHREQLARINRLKEIAERQSQAERIADLNSLLLRSNHNFDSQLAVAKRELPPPEYDNVVKTLEQGRRREVRAMMGGTDGGAAGGAEGDSAAHRVPTSATQRAPTAGARPAATPAPAPPPSRPPH